MSGRDVGIIVLVVIGALILLPLLGMATMGGWGMMGPGMMGPGFGGRWSGGWGMPLGGILWLLILVGIGLVVWSYARRNGAASTGGGEAPLEILKRRLAKGEITREEYDAIKKELS
jgi:putative membrane protein